MSHDIPPIGNELQFWRTALPRFLVLMAVTGSLCSCGVFEIVTAKDEDSLDSAAFMMTLAPPLLITGSSWPKTSSANDFQPLSYWAGFIQSRNVGTMTPERAREILTAMDRCFGDKDVKNMSDGKIESLFGSPDEETTRAGWKVYIYRIQGGKFGERRLVRG